MLVKIEARILIFPGTDFHFPSTSVPPGTFLGSGKLSTSFFFVVVIVVSGSRMSECCRVGDASPVHAIAGLCPARDLFPASGDIPA